MYIVYITVPMSATFTKLIPTVHLDMIYLCHVMVCVLNLHFTFEWPRHKMAMVPITIMSSFCKKWRNYGKSKISGKIWSTDEIWFFAIQYSLSLPGGIYPMRTVLVTFIYCVLATCIQLEIFILLMFTYTYLSFYRKKQSVEEKSQGRNSDVV